MNDVSASLEQIRRLELEMAQRIAAAHDDADAAIATARSEAVRSIEAARERGREAARRHYATTVEAARTEAERVQVEGGHRAARVAVDAAPHLAEAADAMIELLLAPPLEKGK